MGIPSSIYEDRLAGSIRQWQQIGQVKSRNGKESVDEQALGIMKQRGIESVIAGVTCRRGLTNVEK